jgi:beta-xylosidase
MTVFSKRTYSVLATAAIAVLAASVSAEVLYTNPVIPGDHPDPSIIRVGKDYWATCTSSAWGPEFPLLHSRDLVNWEQTGAVLPHRPEWATGDFWAPEISEFHGKFCVYFVARQQNGRLSVAVATADKPGGPYTSHNPMVAQEDGSIDPAPVVDTNGVRYLVWKEDGNSRNKPTPIWLQRLNDDGTQLIDEPHELIRNDTDWEGNLVEAPFILRRGDWFYLFYSGAGCCGTGCNYALGVARAHSLFGPWQKNPSNPILMGNDTWKCPGHGSIIQDPDGKYFLLYHAYAISNSIYTGRQGILDEVTFGSDDWPVINRGAGPSVHAISPLGAVQHITSGGFTNDFHGKSLDGGWQWPQQLEPKFHLANGALYLSPGGHGTNLLGAVLARSTTAADYVATTVIDPNALKPGVAAGISAIGNLENALGVVLQDGRIVAWRRDRGQMRETWAQPFPKAEKVFLRMTATGGYHFQLAASADGKNWMPCGEAVDGKKLPPWDCAVRVALTVGGDADAQGVFDSFSMRSGEKE